MQIHESHVVLPREDFIELSTVANQHTPSLGERAASTAQTGVIFGMMGAGVVATAFGVYKVTDWIEERRYQRTMKLREKSGTAPTQS